MAKAASVDAYLAALPADRRAVAAEVVGLVRRHVPAGYAESMGWGMPVWEIPLARYPQTYNGKPLAYVAFAAQKSHFALYLMGAYADEARRQRLVDGFRAAGRKLDLGKSCLRFARLEDLALEAVGEAIAAVTPEQYIAEHERSRAPAQKPATRAKAVSKARPAAKKQPAKAPPRKSRTG